MSRGAAVLLLCFCLGTFPAVAQGTGTSGGDAQAFRQLLETGLDHSRAARYDDALATYDLAFEMAEIAGRFDWRAKTLRERGVTYLHSAAYEDARADFEESVEIYDSLDEVVQAAKSRLRLISMLSFGQPDQAMEELAEVEAQLQKESGAEKPLRFARMLRARILVHAEDHEAALEVLQTLQEGSSEHRTTDILSLESYALQQLGRYEESKQAYLDLIEAAFADNNQRVVAYAYCNLGDVERELGASQSAEQNLDRAIEALDKLRAEIPGGVEERMTYLDIQVSAYDGKIALLVDQDDKVGALKVAERFHAKSLLEELRAPSEPVRRETLADDERATLDGLIALQRQLIERGLDDEQSAELRALEQRWERVGRARRRETKVPIPSVEPRSPAAVQASLPTSTAMLAYWIHPDRSFLWVMLPDRIELIQIPVGRDALRDSIARYLAPIRDRVRAEDQALRGGNREHLKLGEELNRLLVEPARALLEGVDHLIVIPDDHLWYLPFEALVQSSGDPEFEAEGVWFEEYAHARFLFHDFSVLYAPSATIWAELAERRVGGEGLVAIAPSLAGTEVARERGWSLAPLPGALQEASKVASFAKPGTTILGSEASEAKIKASLPRYRFLHFATHGYLHDVRPQLSGLFLWPNAADSVARSLEDGLFQGFEVRRLPLQAEMVSLAACNSGQGPLSRAEGIVGMARDFLVAGSKNVLVSLWPVDDRSSGSLIEGFYREIQKSSTLPQALRHAKLKLLGETTTDAVVVGEDRVSYAHPYFWATYVMIGGDRLTVPRLSTPAR